MNKKNCVKWCRHSYKRKDKYSFVVRQLFSQGQKYYTNVCLFHTKSDHLYIVCITCKRGMGNNTAHIICMISYIQHYLLYQIIKSAILYHIHCIHSFLIVACWNILRNRCKNISTRKKNQTMKR